MVSHATRKVVLGLVVLTSCTDGDAGGDGTTDAGTSAAASDSSGAASTSLSPDTTAGDTASPDTSAGSSTGVGDLPDPLPPLASAPLTTDTRRAPVHAVSEDPINDPRVVTELDMMLTDGFGDETEAPGEAIIDITIDGSPVPTPGANAALVSRFVHLADTQLADDESPMRLVSFDNDEAFAGAFRPQEAHECRILDAAVRTINAVHAATPVDFVVLGGDNADAAQTNEVEWFVSILDGADVVECDSGDDDDPVPGENNDPKDRFAPVGLDVPWYWVMGNHDVLVQGNFVIQGREALAIGDAVNDTTRDWTMPGGPTFMGPVVPDEDRALLDGSSLLDIVRSSGDGHGVTQAVVDSGKANYTFDVPGTEIRFIAVDTAAQTGGAEGVVRQLEVDDFLRPALDQAEADGKWVLLSSHHASTSLSDGGGLGGMQQPDALTTDEFQGLLGEYDNVIAHLCGHSHIHRVLANEPLGGHAYWEIITSAIADHPHQMRIFELRDEDNGWISLTSIALDISFEGDELGAEGRLRGITDMTSGWQNTGEGLPEDRNVRLWIPAP